MPVERLAFLLGLAAIAACATTAPSPPVPMSPAPVGLPPAQLQPAGELLWADMAQALPSRKSAFDGWRVAGPSVDLARSPDGRWAGTFRGREVAFAAAAGKLTGPGIDIAIVRQPDGSVLASGVWLDATVHIELTSERIRGAAGANAFDLTWMAPGTYNSYAGLLQLKGQAAQVVYPVLPQFVLALVAILLG